MVPITQGADRVSPHRIADDHAVQQLLAWREQTLAGMPHRRALAAQDSAL
jgi:hypothetical protein